MKKILLVGGGIAGLTMLRLLQNKGHHIRLIEKQPEWQISGTGLYMPSNGVVALEKIGLGDVVRQKGFIVSTRHIMNAKGNMILDLDLEKIWNREKPCLGINRKTLHDILLKGIDHTNITLGLTIDKLKANHDNVDVTFSDGKTDTYDIVIGADGLHSNTRTLTLGNIPLRKVTAQICRFIIKRPQHINSWSLYIDTIGQFLIIPMNDTEAYCYVNRKTKGFKTFDKKEYMKPFEKFAAPVSTILQDWNSETSHWDDLEELSPLSIMGKDRIVLIGDAGHGMPPFMAQGGALALEDAVVLSTLLENKDWSTIATSFTKHRTDRINWTRTRNRKREKLSKLPFWIAKLGLKKVGEKNWTEDYRPLAESPNW
ncbi:FAD-dependent monooxygenase [Aquimarina sp. 2201CG14-23]|uniref:FAD-dependent monooxygenase n=1 Tax=Aquimarina mycalae TaxID=3040073 RepID=UPI002477DA60|nr:FAD-dependent monooxygenase [Aquimarina sp. 2201CG14-23]MDH7445095.1 FAD-dependent monooxygenase [Aquimarina sp. 2201CG14-23]